MRRTHLKFAFWLLSLAALSGCDIDGTLSVNQSTTLVDKKGRAVPIVAGARYRTELGKDGDKVKFNIKIDGKEREVRLSPPPGVRIPKSDGDLLIPASRSGQPVDFYGSLNTKDFDGQDQRGSQSCTTQASVRVCQQVPVPSRDGRPTTEERCSFETRTVSGNQQIVFHDRTTTTYALVKLYAPGSRNEVASFDGQRSESQRITTWSGRCETPYDDGRGDGRGPWPGRGDDRGPGGGRGDGPPDRFPPGPGGPRGPGPRPWPGRGGPHPR